jgi:hypothetical protein
VKLLLSLLAVCHFPLAQAHDGHGSVGVHWHATDTLGFVVLGAIVAVALWASRRK